MLAVKLQLMNMKSLLKRSLGLGLSLLLLLGSAGAAAAQNTRNLKERWIFLWDVTISMVGIDSHSDKPGWEDRRTIRQNPYWDYVKDCGPSKNINPNVEYGYIQEQDVFDDTRARLLSLIDDIADEESEIMVFPYTKEIDSPFIVNSASSGDKERIKGMIMSWDNLDHGGTFTGKCLQKVINQYFAKDRINRVIILTDGCPSTTEDEAKLLGILREWDVNDPKTEYYRNRLIYVMLTDEAVEDTLSFDPIKGTSCLLPGEDIDQLLTVSLSDYLIPVHVSEFAKDGFLEAGGNLVLGCERQMGDVKKMSEVRCRFICEENPLISVSSATVKLDESGKFVIPFTFKGNDREYYLNELSASGLTGRVALKCEIDPSCKDIVLEGSDEITVEVIVKPEPRAIISLTKK